MKTILLLLLAFIGYCQPSINIGTAVITGLTNPLQVLHAGDNSQRIYVVEQAGKIKVFNSNYTAANNASGNNEFLNITLSNKTGEQGLLSAAFHPLYASNGYFYIFYTNNAGNLQVDRITKSSTDALMADANTRIKIIEIPHPTFGNHNGGEMHFGQDGFLYISTGDGGNSGDPDENGQNKAKLLGKLLRIDVNQTFETQNYTIPSSNPFEANATGKEIYCVGLRNPFRWSFDRYNGDIYIGDVGQNTREEVSYRKADKISGTNFGWDCMEGTYNHEPTSCTDTTNYAPPIYEYTTTTNNLSIIGGMVYRGYKYTDLASYYICIDFYSTMIRLLKNNGTSWVLNTQNIGISGVSDFGETEAGELLLVQRSGNSIYEIKTSNPKPTYVFTGNGSWMEPSNWADGVVPPVTLPANAIIVIKPIAGGKCTLAQNRKIGSLNNLIIEPKALFELKAVLEVD